MEPGWGSRGQSIQLPGRRRMSRQGVSSEIRYARLVNDFVLEADKLCVEFELPRSMKALLGAVN
jgi:hypothetical protein